MTAAIPFPRAVRAVQALSAGGAAVAGSYAVAGSSPAFVVAPVAAAVVEVAPAALVTASITLLGDAGDLLALWTAVGLTVALLSAAASPGVELAPANAPGGGLLAGAVVAAVAALLSGAFLPALAAGGAAAAVVVVPHLLVGDAPAADAPAPAAGGSTGRRGVLAAVGTALGIALLGGAVAPRSAGGDAGRELGGAAVEDLLGDAEARSLDVEGLEPLVSEAFYTVDIAQIDPAVDADEWTLSVTGNVGEEVSYDYGDVTGRDAEHRFVTLRCVGEDLNGRKLDTALWTGVPLWDLVAPADPAEDCCVRLRAADDYYQVFPLAALRRGFLAYGMNGRTLPRAHGYPARVLIPGHWGEINVKWLTEIEVLDEAVDGYWEERGWHGTGPVNTVAKLWVTNRLDDGRVEVAGHAYAGTRGVERVEVSTDGGDTWSEATLSEPPPLTDAERRGTPTPAAEPRDDLAAAGRDVWRQWVHRYEPDGVHEVVVRAVDGTGAVQPSERSGAFPSGATGWASKTVRP